MHISLGERTAQTVRVYFEKSRESELIRRFLPQRAQSVEEALRDFEQTLLPDAQSFGRIILADSRYVGDVWCYCIDREDTPNAMLSYCILEEEFHGRGIATQAVHLFIEEIAERFSLTTLGAFTYAENAASIRVLQKNGFALMEKFAEEGVLSHYYQLDLS